MIIDIIIKSGQLIFDTFNKLKISNQQDKERISFLLEKISEVLEEVAKKLDENIYPHQKCEEMRMYSQEIINTIGDKLKEDLVKELYDSLMISSEVERLFSEKDEDTTHKIYISAGKFKAASVLVKT